MKPEIAVLIAGIGGAFLGIVGQIIGNQINHKNKIKYFKFEINYQEKIKNYKKILDFLELHKNIIKDFLEGEMDSLELIEYSNNNLDKFLQINPGYHFFNSKQIKNLFEKYQIKIRKINKINDENEIWEKFSKLDKKIKEQIEKELKENINL